MDDKIKKSKDKQEDQELDEKVIEEEEADDALDEEEVKAEVAEDEVEELTEKVKSLDNQLRRAVADYRNLENRNRDEKLEFVKFANKSLLEQLLPAFDTLLLAEKYTKDENFKIAVKHIVDILKTVGVQIVGVAGQKYDPHTMEAIEVVDGKDGEVIEVTQPGFSLNGKIVRPARVKVGGKEKE